MARRRSAQFTNQWLLLLLCVLGGRGLTTCSLPPSASLARLPLRSCVLGRSSLPRKKQSHWELNFHSWLGVVSLSLRLSGGAAGPAQDDERQPEFTPRGMWMPKEHESVRDVDEAWEERLRERDEDMRAEGDGGLPVAMSVGQARERVDFALAMEKERTEQEEALHQQLAQHIQRLKEAHAQITGGAQPCPPELAGTNTASPHRVRQRSRPPPGESPAPAVPGEASAGSTAGGAASANAALAKDAAHGDKLQAIKASTDWEVEGTEERILQHRQDVARKVLGPSPKVDSAVPERGASAAHRGTMLNSTQQPPQAAQSR